MKRTICLLLALVMCLSLVGCGKSKAAKEAEKAIDAIGEVTLDSGDAIKNAEKLYNILTDAEKADVDNRLVLVEAQEQFAKLQETLIYGNAKESFEALKDVATLCVNGMDDIYGAWYFGIYKASNASGNYYFYYDLAKETPNLSGGDLKSAAEVIGFPTSGDSNSCNALKGDWQKSLTVTMAAITLRGDYDTITTKMDAAKKCLQKLTEEYDDYTYYPKLKEYYAAVSSYVEFYTNPTGSFNQLADTVKEFENTIRTYEADVSFLFNK